eukprot:TRINITY_DN9361_c0_g1_i2.p1 TRINITY_DN9361_c0_g1~~TRINITY_DN9361_c0_g1_i2.p1  ORF type:complete len:591 (+),score=115.11 TRINITY_DN9361_c0_g1_i2:39-1775(+)
MEHGFALSNGTSYLHGGGRLVSETNTTYALEPGPASSDTCPSCGNVYMPDSLFCRNCGRRRDSGPEAGHAQVAYGAPSYAASYVTGCGMAGAGSGGTPEVQRYVTGGTTSYLSQAGAGTSVAVTYEPQVAGVQQPMQYQAGGAAQLQGYGTTTSSYIPPVGVTGATTASYVSPPMGAVVGATTQGTSYLPAAGGASSSYVPAPMMQTTASYVPPMGAGGFVGGAVTPQLPVMVPGPTAQMPHQGVYAAGQQQGVFAPGHQAVMMQPPPVPPGRLTPGSALEDIPDPTAIDEQKAAYNRSLEEQAKQGEDILKMQQKQQTEYIYQAAEAQKKQIICQIEQQAKQRELQLSQQFSQQCMSLQQEFQNQKMILERQAHDLAMEWQRRKSQEEMMHQQYEMQKAHYDDQIRMIREMQEAQLSHEQAQREAQAAMAAQQAQHMQQAQAAAMVVQQPQAPLPPAGSYVPPAAVETGPSPGAIYAAPVKTTAVAEPSALHPSQSTGSYVPPATVYGQGCCSAATGPAPLGMAGQYGMGASQATNYSMVAPGAASHYSAAPTVYSQYTGHPQAMSSYATGCRGGFS